jgi:methylmalonyl-CoA/ethylmalonyl-CoA epimerase
MLPALSSIFGPIRQVAYVVENIDSAIDHWHHQLGLTPFAVVRGCSPFAGARYRGQPIDELVVNLAFAYIGDVQLELIEQVNDVPSIYREALERGAHGLHHYGVCVDDYTACFEHAISHGFTPVVEAGTPGYSQMAYVESTKIPGLILEIIEWNDYTRPYFDGIGEFLAGADKSVLQHPYTL